MILLPIENKTKEEIISNFSEILNLKKEDSGKILLFFQDEGLPEIIKKIFDKFYKELIFVFIYTSKDVK